MTAILWYLLLAFIGMTGIGYVFYKKRDAYKVSTLLVFVLSAAGAAWTAEFTILGLFNSYSYRVGVFDDIWAQNLLGHLILNTSVYPAIAIVMVAFSFKYRWIAFSATVLTLIEYLFVKLRIYEQHWWRYYMTFAAVIIFLLVIRKWFEALKQKPYGIARSVTFYFAALVITHIPAPVLLLLGKQYYQMNWANNLFDNFYLVSLIIIYVYHLIESFLLVVCTCILKKWYWRVLPFIISIGVQTLLVRMNVLVTVGSWNLIYTLIIYEAFIAIYILLEKNALKPMKYGYEK